MVEIDRATLVSECQKHGANPAVPEYVRALLIAAAAEVERLQEYGREIAYLQDVTHDKDFAAIRQDLKSA